MTTDEWRNRKAHAAAAALHLNAKEEDGYLKALLTSRHDLTGLPFAMGNACRTSGARAKAFKKAAEAAQSTAPLDGAPGPDAGEAQEEFYQACLAVVSQVIPAKEASDQQALVRVLSSVPRPEATRALARLAVFSTDKGVRAAAVEALAVRREGGSAAVLVAGLSYPWPEIADNAADAIAKLKREDLVPHLRTGRTQERRRWPSSSRTWLGGWTDGWASCRAIITGSVPDVSTSGCASGQPRGGLDWGQSAWAERGSAGASGSQW